MIEITTETFTDFVSQTGTILVDFWGPWCGPCKALMPALEDIATSYADRGVSVGKINIDENPDIVDQFRIKSVPTVMIFQDGELVNTVVGADRNRIITALDNSL